MRNTYNLEEELAEVVLNSKKDFDEMAPKVVEFESIQTDGAELVIIAHGIVAAAAKKAIFGLHEKGYHIGLFRPITLSPFPEKEADNLLMKAKQIIVFESSLGQLGRLLKMATFGMKKPFTEVLKPGVGFTPEEIIQTVEKKLERENVRA